MNTNCQNCDRDQCPTLFATFARMPTASRNRAMADCANHTVNWRARALTEKARADAAEAMVVVAESVLIGMALYAEKSHARPYDTTASAWQMGVNEATVGIGTDLLRLIRPYTEVASIAFAAEMRRRQS